MKTLDFRDKDFEDWVAVQHNLSTEQKEGHYKDIRVLAFYDCWLASRTALNEKLYDAKCPFPLPNNLLPVYGADEHGNSILVSSECFACSIDENGLTGIMKPCKCKNERKI